MNLADIYFSLIPGNVLVKSPCSDVSDVVLINPLTENLFDSSEGVWSHHWFGHTIPSLQVSISMFVVVAPEHSLTLHTAIIVQEAVFLKSAFCICSQMLQMSASLGWSRFALMMNLMTSPLQSDQFSDDVTNRQVSFCGRISNLNRDCEINRQSGLCALAEAPAMSTASPELGGRRTLLH